MPGPVAATLASQLTAAGLQGLGWTAPPAGLFSPPSLLCQGFGLSLPQASTAATRAPARAIWASRRRRTRTTRSWTSSALG